MIIIFVFLLGSALGSFTAAFAWRYPRRISIVKVKRSFCESCKKDLKWYDNLPLLSFLLLGGRCRYCHHQISWRNFLTELFGGLTACFWFSLYGPSWLFVVSLVISFLLYAILIIDLDAMIIPDELIWLLFVLSLVGRLPGNLFLNLLGGFLLGFFLLFLNLLTRGRGMGLGDVKLMIPLGFFLGWPAAIYSLWGSFILGALVGIGLLVTKKKGLKSKIPFGPFIVLSFLGSWIKMVI